MPQCRPRVRGGRHPDAAMSVCKPRPYTLMAPTMASDRHESRANTGHDLMSGLGCEKHRYSIFGITIDRKHELKWLFHQEKATFHCSQKVDMYSENALVSTSDGRECRVTRQRLWSLRRIGSSGFHSSMSPQINAIDFSVRPFLAVWDVTGPAIRPVSLAVHRRGRIGARWNTPWRKVNA